MKHLVVMVVLAGWVLVAMPSLAASNLAISLTPNAANPAAPQMGDQLKFNSDIRNAGGAPVDGVVAWISMVRMDPGHEQPMDLEDWSAHKAVTRARLDPNGTVAVSWPMRLIQAGDYRVVISAVTRGAKSIVTSPFVDFHVRPKPVVSSARVLPVSLGVPLLLGGAFAWRMRRRFRRG